MRSPLDCYKNAVRVLYAMRAICSPLSEDLEESFTIVLEHYRSKMSLDDAAKIPAFVDAVKKEYASQPIS